MTAAAGDVVRSHAPGGRTGLVLADLVPGVRAQRALIVLAGAAFVGALAQVTVPLPFTPVPVSMQPFAALVVGAACGWRRGSAALLVYLAAGLAGLPWYAGHTAGVSVLLSANGGYLVGFVVAAGAVGALAQRDSDHSPVRMFATMLLGSALIYSVGVPWLMADLHVGLPRGLALGFTPFFVGDLLKSALAAILLPGAWALIRRRS